MGNPSKGLVNCHLQKPQGTHTSSWKTHQYPLSTPCNAPQISIPNHNPPKRLHLRLQAPLENPTRLHRRPSNLQKTNQFRRNAPLVPAKPRTQPITNAKSLRSRRTKRKPSAAPATEPQAQRSKRTKSAASASEPGTLTPGQVPFVSPNKRIWRRSQ